MTRINLPLELVLEILLYLPRSDLKQIRLVCRSLVEPVNPYLFDIIVLAAVQVNLEHTRLMLRHFDRYIKVVMVSLTAFYTLSKPDYCAEVIRNFEWAKVERTRYQWRKHLDLGFATYSKLCGEASDILSTGQISELFREAIVKIPSIRRLVITDKYREKPINDLTMADYCPSLDCRFSHEAHAYFRPAYGEGIVGFGDNSQSAMRSILLALSTTSSNIREFTTEFDVESEALMVTPSALDMPSLQMNQGRDFLSRLTKLWLTLSAIPWTEEVPMSHGSVAKALAHACSLKSLIVDIRDGMEDCADHLGISTFRATLDGCKFPKLRTFILAFASVEESELKTFISQHTSLQVLVLFGVCLKSGLWKEVADTIRNKLLIKAIQMNRLDCGFEGPGIRYLEWKDWYGDVDRFFFKNGPNPFSVTEIARWLKDVKEEKPRPRPCGSLPYMWYLDGAPKYLASDGPTISAGALV